MSTPETTLADLKRRLDLVDLRCDDFELAETIESEQDAALWNCPRHGEVSREYCRRIRCRALECE